MRSHNDSPMRRNALTLSDQMIFKLRDTSRCQGNNSIKSCVGGWSWDNLAKLLRDYCKVLWEHRSLADCSEISWRLRPCTYHHAEEWRVVRNDYFAVTGSDQRSDWDSDNAALTLKWRDGPMLCDLMPDQPWQDRSKGVMANRADWFKVRNSLYNQFHLFLAVRMLNTLMALSTG